MHYKCIYGKKIGDSLIQDENGEIISIKPDTFYERNLEGFWMLKKIVHWWKIVRVLVHPKG